MQGIEITGGQEARCGQGDNGCDQGPSGGAVEIYRGRGQGSFCSGSLSASFEPGGIRASGKEDERAAGCSCVEAGATNFDSGSTQGCRGCGRYGRLRQRQPG